MKMNLKIFLFTVSLLSLISCQGAKDVNRVSGGYFDKSVLKGEWYFGASIVDKQYHNASSFIGAACASDRIRFELTENMLYAYRSYEKVAGTEAGNPGSQNLLAAFPVLKHFDVQREYNEVSGVENNVISENDYDKKWYKRQFVRIDWTKNMAPDTDCNEWFTMSSFAQIQRETHPREPYRVRVSKDYIESTQEALIKPSQEACDSVGEWSCQASRVRMKLSFKKIQPTNYTPKSYPDSIPLEYGVKNKALCFKGEQGCENLQALWTYAGPGGTEICDPMRHNIDECTQHEVPVFSRFGFFRTEKHQFNRENGFTLTGRSQLINRWNIWEDADKKVPKPIVYVVNVQFPEELFETAQEMARDWSTAFEEVTHTKDMFQIRRNTCNIENVKNYITEFSLGEHVKKHGINQIDKGNLEEVCAVLEWESSAKKLSKIFKWEQLGDIRYNILNYSDKAELAGPLGYGPSFADPVTGEIVHGAANIYGAALDTYAAMGADIVQSLNRQISNSDLMKDDKKAIPVSTIDSFSRLIKARTKDLTNDTYFVKIADGTPNNWDLLKDLHLEDKYLLKEFRPSELAGQLEALEKKVAFFGNRSACYLSDMVEPQVADLAMQLKDKSWMEVYQHIRAAVFRGVASHEIGHTLGLRHNFAGSVDALNYFPSFWKEETRKKSELRYSSIMDYMQRFNSDFSGIGLYDRAAIKFGYGDLVEVFDETGGAFVPAYWNSNAKLFHYTDLPYLYAGGELNDKLKAHYTQVKANFDGGGDAKIDIKSLGVAPKSDNLYRRRNISFDEFYLSSARKVFGKKDQPIVYEVPYQYCSDAYAWGGGLTCNRWDMGASAEEIVDNAAELYENYYWFNSFRRDRISISPGGYMARLYGRTYQPMLNPFKYLYRYQRTSLNIWPLVRDWNTAAYKGINFLGKVLQSVEPGRYCLTKDNMYLPEIEVPKCEGAIEIGMDQGRYYDTHYSSQFFYKPNNIGHMYDKLLAMYALTDSRAYFMRDFSDRFNRGAFSIGYYRVFAPEMIKLFSGLMLDNKKDISPYLLLKDGVPEIQYRPVIDIEKKNVDLPRIKSSGSWMMRHYSLLLPVINFSSPVDGQLDYIKRARITLVGSQHDPATASKVQQLIFEDPKSKKQYRSVVVDSEELSPGYQLLNEAKVFASDADMPRKDLDLYERFLLIDMLRMLGDALDGGR
ncbi:MAG: zinc-dependent metalloprotease [Myxococcota bacterium]